MKEASTVEMRSGNPAFSEKTFDSFQERGIFNEAPTAERMTVEGAATKTGILLLLAVVTAAVTWHLSLDAATRATGWMLAIGGLIGGLITALIVSFNPKAAPIGGPIYALFEGLALGAISASYDWKFPGIVGQAVGLTFGVMAVMLIAYMGRLVRATPKFYIGVIAATGGVLLFSLSTLALSAFGVDVSSLYNSSPLAIGISVVILIIAALNLVIDFDVIERGAAQGAPKFMEWYAAFGLMVTLVWLYLRILRLLSQLNRR